jgi:hypothetical protein
MARVEGTGDAAVCVLCGGPRIAAGLGGEEAAAALKEEKRSLSTAHLASMATLIQGALAAIATAIGLLLHPATLVGKLVVFALAVVPLILAIGSRARATSARARAKEARGRAWQAAAQDAAGRVPSGISVTELARVLGVDSSHADRLLTSLAVEDKTRIDVGEDAEVRYTVAPEARAEVEADAVAEVDRSVGKEPIR